MKITVRFFMIKRNTARYFKNTSSTKLNSFSLDVCVCKRLDTNCKTRQISLKCLK